MKFGLSDPHWKLVEEKAISPLKGHSARVWVFGSRARGDFREFSDLDLLYEAATPIPLHVLSRVKEDLEESRLPILVDLVDAREIATSFKESVYAERIEI